MTLLYSVFERMGLVWAEGGDSAAATGVVPVMHAYIPVCMQTNLNGAPSFLACCPVCPSDTVPGVVVSVCRG